MGITLSIDTMAGRRRLELLVRAVTDVQPALRVFGGYLRTKFKDTYVVSSSVYVPDGGAVSGAGAFVFVQLPAPPTFALTFNLVSPAGKFTTWKVAELGPPRAEYHLFGVDAVGTPCSGTWSFYVVGSSFGMSVALASWSLFVEGAGASGLGGDLVDWAAYLDPALAGSSGVGVDLDAALAAMRRIQHSHTKGYLLRSLTAIPDDPLTLPDACLPG